MKWKLNYYNNSILIKIINLLLKKKIKIIIFNKSSHILYNLLNTNILVYNGFFMKKLFISKFIINYKIGLFIHTKKIFKFNKKQKKKKR